MYYLPTYPGTQGAKKLISFYKTFLEWSFRTMNRLNNSHNMTLRTAPHFLKKI